MKKIILMILLVSSLFAWSSVQKQAENNAKVVCKLGYAFLVSSISTPYGVDLSVSQIYSATDKPPYIPQPIKCKVLNKE